MGNGLRSLPRVDVVASADVDAALPSVGPLVILSLAPQPSAVEALRDRFLALVEKGAGPDGTCWRWLGAKNSQGTPHMRVDAWTTTGAARVAFLLLGVPLPLRSRVRRNCATLECVCPMHHIAEAFTRPRRSTGRVQRPRLSPTVQARIVHEHVVAGVPRRVLALRFQRPLRTIAAVIERARAQTAPKET